MAVNLSPVAGAAAQFFDNSGNVLTGGKLYTYDAGTTTPAVTYTTSSGATAHPNPIVLDAAGRVPDSGEIWLADNISYKFVLKDQNDVLIGTYDNLVGINSNFVNFTGEEETQTATQGQTVFTLTTLTYQPSANNLLVFVNGSKQVPVDNFVETSSTVVTFVDGLNVGDVVDFCTATPINTNTVTAAQVAYNEGQAGAVNQTVEFKLQQSISVQDFGAIADAVVTGNNVVGTDNLAAFTDTLNAAVSNGISTILVPGGFYYLSAGFTLPRGITLQGDGTSHLPIVTQSSSRTGTCLLINGAVGADCIAFESNAGHSALTNMSIYNTNTNAIRAVVSIVGQLWSRMTNIEIGSLKRSTGAGLYLQPATTGALYETLWGAFNNVVVTITDIGASNEASLRYGLQIYATGVAKVCNANSFVSGAFAGTWAGLYIDGAVSGADNISCVFQGTKFDSIWDGTFTPKYVENSDGLFGYLVEDCYIYPTLQIKRANATAFHGCYFESAGNPATYDDGTHGVLPLIATVWNDTTAIKTGIIDSAFNGTYLYDIGTLTLTTPDGVGERYDTRLATRIKLKQNANQAIPTSAWTKADLNNVVFGDNSQMSWDATNKKVEIRSNGTYLVTANITFDGFPISSGAIAYARIVASNGYSVESTTVPALGNTIYVTPSISSILDLSRGDTLELDVFQTSGGNLNLIANLTTLSVVKIG